MADTAYVRRFSRTERAVHWVNAPAFFLLLASGLVLYVPALSDAVGRRGLIKAIHLYVAIGWVAALLVVCLAGDRRGLRETRRELERLDLDDARWLAGWSAPQGRFNAGQKLHAIVQAAFAVLFVVSGALLWLGERNTTLRFSGTIVLHDALMYIATILVAGHLYLALLSPSTRHSLRGMVRGSVRASWAREHHPKWAGGPSTRLEDRWPRPGVRRFLIGFAVAVASVSVYAAVRPHTAARATASAFAPAPVPPAIARGSALANRALALDQSGDAAGAVPLYAQAVQTLPGVAQIRTYYGWALARTGHSSPAVAQLREAVRLDPSLPDARLYLGALLQRGGQRRQARAQLTRAVPREPGGPAGR
jgi:formate dehydrogenase subunit gamma